MPIVLGIRLNAGGRVWLLGSERAGECAVYFIPSVLDMCGLFVVVVVVVAVVVVALFSCSCACMHGSFPFFLSFLSFFQPVS
jgi:hypothetical protein